MKALFAGRILVSLFIAVALFLISGVLYPRSLGWPGRAVEWVVDTSGPEIVADLPVGYVQGVLPVRVALLDESGADVSNIAVDGKPIPAGRGAELDTSQLPDGEHVLFVEAVDRSLRENSSRRSFSFRTDNTPPKVAAQIDPPQAGQGRTLVVSISPSEEVTLTGSLDGHDLLFLRSQDRYWSVLGFAPDSRIGTRSLEFLAVDRAGLQARIQITVSVGRVDYPSESLIIPEDRSELLSPAIVEAEIAFLDKVFAATIPDKLWSGPFAMPAQGETSSPFAIRRSYNGGPLGSHHGGMDIAAPEGLPVAAANRGRVVVAGPLKVRGNVVILDHGMGVYSAYYHLSSIKVQKDQMVEKNQIVGLLGNTGLSTGAHLHWEMRVSGAAVDPLEWTKRVIPY